MGAFRSWLNMNEMAVQTTTRFGKPIPNLDSRDDVTIRLR